MSTTLVHLRRSSALCIGLLASVIALPSIAAETASTSQLLQSIASGAKDKRYAAIDHIGERHEHAALAVPALQKLLQDSDAHIRWRAARALGEYGELAKGSAAGLRKQLGDNDPIVQYHAAVALGKLGDTSDETVEALTAAATSKDTRVARGAIAALRNLKPGPKRVAAALEKALQSNDQAVTLHALEAIVEQGAKATPLLKEALDQPKTAYLACAAIEKIGPDAAPVVPELTALLGKTKHSHMLIQTLLALASIGPAAASAAPQITPLLDSPNDATLPVAAAYALGCIGASDADAELHRAAASNDPFLQMMAMWALSKSHPDDHAAMQAAVEKLTQGLKSDKVAMRMAAAKSLHMLHAPPEMVGPSLVALVNDPNPEVQTNVVDAVASLGEAVVPRVNLALKNPQLRGPALRVLSKLGPKGAAAVPSLIEAANSADPKFRTEVQMTLAAIGPSAAPATDMLITSLASKDQGERESALLALRKIGPGAKAAAHRLTRKMMADDSFEANASAWALARIAPDDAQAAPAVVAKLTKGLSHPNEQTRLECVEAITAMGAAAQSAKPALERAAKEDSSAGVRAAAEAALHPKADDK